MAEGEKCEPFADFRVFWILLTWLENPNISVTDISSSFNLIGRVKVGDVHGFNPERSTRLAQAYDINIFQGICIYIYIICSWSAISGFFIPEPEYVSW